MRRITVLTVQVVAHDGAAEYVDVHVPETWWPERELDLLEGRMQEQGWQRCTCCGAWCQPRRDVYRVEDCCLPCARQCAADEVA